MIAALLLAAATYLEPVYPNPVTVPVSNIVELTVGELRAREQASFVCGYTNALVLTARMLKSKDYLSVLGRPATPEQREILRWLGRTLEHVAGVRNDRKGEDDD